MPMIIVPPNVRKALIIVSCILIGLMCGTMYMFSAYSTQLATRLAFTTTQTSSIALIGSLGMSLIGPIAGYIVDTRGFALPTVLSGLFVALGYYFIWYAYEAGKSHFLLVALSLSLVGIGSQLGFTAAIKCCTVNFPLQKALAAAMPISAFGLSASFFSFFSSLAFPGKTEKLLAMMVIAPLVFTALSLPAFRYSVTTLPVYEAIPQTGLDHRLRERLESLQPGMDSIGSRSSDIELTQLSSGLSTPKVKADGDLSPSSYLSPKIGSPGVLDGEFERASAKSEVRTELRSELFDVTGIQLLKYRAFWSCTLILGLLAGIGQLYIYSCGYMIRALVQSYDLSEVDVQKIQQYHVALISLASFSGRILAGFFSDFIYTRHGLVRNYLLAVPGILTLINQLLGMFINDINGLGILSLSSGLAYGYCYGLFPTIIADTFGLKNFAQTYGITALSPIVTSYGFNLLFGIVYDSHTVTEEVEYGKTVHYCNLGYKCYSPVFGLSVVFSSIALGLIAENIVRTGKGKLYHMIFGRSDR